MLQTKKFVLDTVLVWNKNIDKVLIQIDYANMRESLHRSSAFWPAAGKSLAWHRRYQSGWVAATPAASQPGKRPESLFAVPADIQPFSSCCCRAGAPGQPRHSWATHQDVTTQLPPLPLPAAALLPCPAVQVDQRGLFGTATEFIISTSKN